MPVVWHVTLAAMLLLNLPQLLCIKCSWSSLVMPRLNTDKRNHSIGMVWAGTDVNQVAGAFGVYLTTIPVLRDKFANTGSLKDKPQPGQPRKSTAQDDHSITLRVLQSSEITARKLQQDLHKIRNVRLSTDSICRCIKTASLKWHQPYRGLVLTPAHRRACLRWVRHYQRDTLERWVLIMG